jgi:putative resolvase
MSCPQSTALVSHPQAARLVSIGYAAKFASVNNQTIRRYLASGLIEGMTTPGGHRRIDLQTVADCFGITVADEACDSTSEAENESNTVCIMARVSSLKQKPDLLRQVADLRRYADDHYPGQRMRVLQGIGSGLNDSRREFLSLIDLIVEHKCSIVLVTYRERICRFGIKLVEHLCKAHGVTIVETGGEDNERKERTLQEDMVDSCLAVLHCFSAKMMGARGGARTKIIYPPGFRERVAALLGAGLSLRNVVAVIEKESWYCQNTGKKLGWRPIRRLMIELGGATIIPASVKTFLRKKCTIGTAKSATTAALYDAYVVHCGAARPLTRDKFTAFLKHSIRGLRIENGAVSVAYGLTLKSGRPA